MVVGNLQVERTAQNVANDLGSDTLLTTFVGAASMGGGLVLADWVANRALPMVGMGTSPDSIMDLAGLLAVKGGTAGGAAYVASQTQGLPQVGAAFVALGALASAGIDIFDTFTDLPSLSAGASGGMAATATQSRSTPTVKRSRKRVASSSSGSSSGGAGLNDF